MQKLSSHTGTSLIARKLFQWVVVILSEGWKLKIFSSFSTLDSQLSIARNSFNLGKVPLFVTKWTYWPCLEPTLNAIKMKDVTTISKSNWQSIVIGWRRVGLIFDRRFVEWITANSALHHETRKLWVNNHSFFHDYRIGRWHQTHRVCTNVPWPHSHRIPFLYFKPWRGRSWLCCRFLSWCNLRKKNCEFYVSINADSDGWDVVKSGVLKRCPWTLTAAASSIGTSATASAMVTCNEDDRKANEESVVCQQLVYRSDHCTIAGVPR